MSTVVSAHFVQSISAVAKTREGHSWVDVSIHHDTGDTFTFVAHFAGTGNEVKAEAYAAAINGVDASPAPAPEFSSEAA